MFVELAFNVSATIYNNTIIIIIHTYIHTTGSIL